MINVFNGKTMKILNADEMYFDLCLNGYIVENIFLAKKTEAERPVVVVLW